MKHISRGPDRRKQSQIETGRHNWTPSGNSYLCKAHFAAEKMRVDGTRLLK
nr:unnamed protein product [Callosobruchus analis]